MVFLGLYVTNVVVFPTMQFLVSTCNPILTKAKPKPKEEPPKEKKESAPANNTEDQSKATTGNGDPAADPATENMSTADPDSKPEMDLD